MSIFFCMDCEGSGVNGVGDDCPGCDGSRNGTCEKRHCTAAAVGFDDSGRALCEDCLFEWQSELTT